MGSLEKEVGKNIVEEEKQEKKEASVNAHLYEQLAGKQLKKERIRYAPHIQGDS